MATSCDRCEQRGHPVEVKAIRQMPFTEYSLTRIDLCGNCYSELTDRLLAAIQEFEAVRPLPVVMADGRQPPF